MTFEVGEDVWNKKEKIAWAGGQNVLNLYTIIAINEDRVWLKSYDHYLKAWFERIDDLSKYQKIQVDPLRVGDIVCSKNSNAGCRYEIMAISGESAWLKEVSLPNGGFVALLCNYRRY